MNILNAVRGQPLARKTLALSLLAALCTLHARTALPDTPPGTAPASVSEATPDLTPLTSATSAPTPSDDSAGTLGASTLQPGVSSILARLSPAIIYVPPVVTDPVDLAILDARKAMQANNLAAFDTAAALVPRGHALSSYLDYWRLRIRLAASDPTDAEYLAVSADARAYLKQFPRTLTADLLRRDWMLAAGRRQDWATIDALYPAWTLKDESAPECLMALSAIARTPTGQHPGAATLKAATAQILQPVALNPTCTALLQTLAEHGLITPAQRQQRLNLALEINNPAEIRQAVALLPQPPDAKALDLALNKPAQLLNATALLVPTAKAPLRSAAITQPGVRTASHRSQTSAHLIPADGRQHATVLTVAQREAHPRSGTAHKSTNATRAAGRTKASLAHPGSKGAISRTHKAATGKATHKTTHAAAQKSGTHRKAGAAAATAAAASKAAARTPLTPVLTRIALVRLARQDPARAAALMDAGKTPDGRALKLNAADRQRRPPETGPCRPRLRLVADRCRRHVPPRSPGPRLGRTRPECHRQRPHPRLAGPRRPGPRGLDRTGAHPAHHGSRPAPKPHLDLLARPRPGRPGAPQAGTPHLPGPGHTARLLRQTGPRRTGPASGRPACAQGAPGQPRQGHG